MIICCWDRFEGLLVHHFAVLPDLHLIGRLSGPKWNHASRFHHLRTFCHHCCHLIAVIQLPLIFGYILFILISIFHIGIAICLFHKFCLDFEQIAEFVPYSLGFQFLVLNQFIRLCFYLLFLFFQSGFWCKFQRVR